MSEVLRLRRGGSEHVCEGFSFLEPEETSQASPHPVLGGSSHPSRAFRGYRMFAAPCETRARRRRHSPEESIDGHETLRYAMRRFLSFPCRRELHRRSPSPAARDCLDHPQKNRLPSSFFGGPSSGHRGLFLRERAPKF